MEFIPKKYRKADLPIPASFEADDLGLEVSLEPTADTRDSITGVHERVEGTGCKVKFRGGKLQVANKALMALLMKSGAYRQGTVRIDSEDVTGFWRQTGMVQCEMRPVYVGKGQKHPNFDEIDLKAIKPPDEKDKPEPLMKA